MIQRVFGTLLFLTLCMGSSAAVPDMDEPYAGILDMAERRTTFAVTDDGAVYSASWGDFGPSLALDPADAEREDFVLAMELRDPKKLRLKSWAGFCHRPERYPVGLGLFAQRDAGDWTDRRRF